MSEIEEGATAPETTEVETAGQSTEETSVDQSETPEWVTKELERARKDAAKYRERAKTAADETETRLREEFSTREAEFLKVSDELTAQYHTALDEKKSAENALARLTAALESGVDATRAPALAERLQGETPEDLKADAERLLGLFHSDTRRGDPSQGATTSTPAVSNMSAYIQRLSK